VHKEFSIIKQDWQFINSFADWFSAFGTIAAVIVALYLARQDKRIRLLATAGHRVIVSQGSKEPHPQYLTIRITNVGHRDVQVIGIGWRIGLFKKSYADQTIICDGISSTLPVRLSDGDEACYYFPLFNEIEWLRGFIQKMLLPHPRWNLWFTHVRIYTSVGKVFEVSLEQGLKKRIMEYVKQNPMLKPRA
jgi:hypothetical protein